MITLLDQQFEQSSHQQNDKVENQQCHAPCHCCLLLPHSCLRSQDHSPLKQQTPFRFVLVGPAQSGKSSLLFQLACSMASRNPRASVAYIRVQDEISDTISRRNDDTCWLPLDGCCFAEIEEKLQSSHARNTPASSISGQQLLQTQTDWSLPSSYFNEPSILSRIHVHHVVCIRDVYQMLLSGKIGSSHYGNERMSLIVLDDLDRLFPSQQHSNNKQDPHMVISQLCKFQLFSVSFSGRLSCKLSVKSHHCAIILYNASIGPSEHGQSCSRWSDFSCSFHDSNSIQY
jgi:hypothetical protein